MRDRKSQEKKFLQHICRRTYLHSVQSLSRVQLFVTARIPARQASVHHQLPEFTQTHPHRVSDAIQPSHPLSSLSPALNPSQHQTKAVISALLLLFLFSCPVMSDSFATPWIGIFQARILERVAISFLQRIFLTQGSNPHLLPASPALQANSLSLSHWGSPLLN